MAVEKPTITFVTHAFAKPQAVTRPDFATLFALTDKCDKQCRVCDKCREAYAHALYSPRCAALMYQSAEFLEDHLRGDDEEYTELKAMLPRTGRLEGPMFYYRFINLFALFQNTLASGDFPIPNSIAEQLALDITLDTMEDQLEMASQGEVALFDFPELEEMLPPSPEDFHIPTLFENLFEDVDFLALYNEATTHADQNADRILFGFPDLRVHRWFDPFRSQAQ